MSSPMPATTAAPASSGTNHWTKLTCALLSPKSEPPPTMLRWSLSAM